MDKKVISTFIAKANSSSIDLLSRAVKETEKELKVALTSNEIMQLVTMTMQFKSQMKTIHVGACATMVYKDSLIAPTYSRSSNFLLERIALSIGVERRYVRRWRETLDSSDKPFGTTNVINSINAIGKLKYVNVEEAANKLAKSILAFCEEDLLLATVILHTNGNVVATGNNIGCSARMSNVIFGTNGVYNTALQQVRAELKNTYKDFKEDLTMSKKEIKELMAQNKQLFSKEDIVDVNDMLLEGDVKGAEEMVNEIISASTEPEAPEACVEEAQSVSFAEQMSLFNTKQVSPVEQINALADDDAEARQIAEIFGIPVERLKKTSTATTTTPVVTTASTKGDVKARIKATMSSNKNETAVSEAKKEEVCKENFTEGARFFPSTNTKSATLDNFTTPTEVLDAQIKVVRHSEDVATLSKELQSIGVTVEGIALDMEQGLHKMKVGDTRYAVSNTKKRIQANLDAFYSRIEKVLDKPKYCFPRNGWLQPCGEYVSFGTLNKISNKATIKVAQIPSRKERVAKQVAEPVAPTQVSTQTVTPVQTTPVATTVVKTVPVQTTASKGVPTPKNPKGGNGVKRDVRIQVRATGDRYVGYVAVAKLSTKAGEKVVSKTIKAEGDHIANALWNVLADALDAVDKNKVGRVFIDVPDIFVKAINTHKNGFKKFKWAREEALRFADARDEFAINQLVFRTNGGCGFKTDAAFVTPSPSTRKEVGVAPTVRE